MTKYSKKTAFIALAALLLVSCISCAPTPDEDYVVNKNEDSHHKASSTAADADITHIDDGFSVRKEDVSIVVDADVVYENKSNDIIRVKAKDITEEDLHKWTRVLFEGNEAFEPRTELSKSEIEQKILEIRSWQNPDRLKQEYQDEDIDAVIDYYESMINDYEAMYNEAPENVVVKETDWSFHKDYYYDRNLGMNGKNDTYEFRCETPLNKHTAEIWAWNRNEKDYSTHAIWFFYKDEQEMKDIPRKELSEEEALALSDELLDKLGISALWTMDSIRCEMQEKDRYYYIVYVPFLNGKKIERGPDIIYGNSDLYSGMLRYSEIRVTLLNGIIRNVEADTPLMIDRVEEENVPIMNISQSYEQFKKQAQIQFVREALVDNSAGDFEKAKIDVNINRIKSSMFRVKVKDSVTEYQLIPVWIYVGNVSIDSDGVKLKTDEESQLMILNAMDGSVIDPQLGY